jgi:alpha-2-macroglobulin-like protein
MFQPNDHVAAHVDDYLHELLSQDDAGHVQRHCETCPACRTALDEARRRLAALRSVPAKEAPQTLIQSTLARVNQPPVKRPVRWRRWVLAIGAPVAAAVLVLACLHVYYLNLAPNSIDLSVYGQSQLLAGAGGSVRVRLMDHRRGTALAGVPVTIELRNQARGETVELAHFTTDAQGTGSPRFTLPDWDNGDYEFCVVARPPGDTETVTEKVRLRRSWKVMLSTDKPVYQPGQEIHVRSLALRQADLKPITGREVTYTVTDAKGNVIFKRKDVTSAYGIAACDCLLADEILEGAYTVRCLLGDTESRQTVDVKKYVLPKFKVAVEVDKPFYEPGDRVQGKVKANYFFGKPVAGAAVEVEARKANEEKPLARVTATSDDKGEAAFELELPAKAEGRVVFQATVTDTAGQKQTGGVPRVVSELPLRVEVIPEAGTLVEGVVNTVYFFVTTPDGQPVKARVAVSGVEQELTTSDLGVASLEFTPTGMVDWTVKVSADQGRRLSRGVRLRCGQAGNDFLVRPDRSVYDGGDTMKLVALGSGREPVFVDLIKDGQTVLTQTVPLADGRGELTFDLPLELFGTVRLCAYRYDADGEPAVRTRVLYVRPARQLNVKAQPDREEYRPGGKARVGLTLTDPEGKPVPGAVSLAAVDEAVFSVQDDSPGMEKTFYTLERELLKPVYDLYPWSPDLKSRLPAGEREPLEQALFANSARIIEDRDAPHSLTATTFPAKKEATAATRQRALTRLWLTWWFLVFFGMTLVIGVAFGVLLVRGDRVTVLAMTAIGAGVVGLIIVSLPWDQHGPRYRAIGFIPSSSEPLDVEISGLSLEGRGRLRSDLTIPDVGLAFTDKHMFNADRIDPVSHIEVYLPVGLPPQPRVRDWFPETLLWRPQVITDDHGHATVSVDLADSITTWRLTAGAVAADGRLGATQAGLRVFQPFFVDLNLPVALTRGDEVAVPAVVYNYLDRPQTVTLTLADADWFDRTGDAVRTVELKPGEVRAESYRLRVKKVGNHRLQVSATAGDVADAVRRNVEVVPDGKRVEQVFNGNLVRPAQLVLAVPDNAVEGSPRAILKVYPSGFSQLVEGLDGIFQMPHGCFEQTSSTTYPNVLALDYLVRTGKSVPAVEAKAREYVHLGYQRLVSFEVPGGGFDWFGHPPANRVLTAYGLMEFQDMARVHDVDPQLIERTRDWLLKQRRRDGSWLAEPHSPHDAPAAGFSQADEDLAATAYVAWAVFGDGKAESEREPTRTHLLKRRPAELTNAHVLALVCNALLAVGARDAEVAPYLERLEELRQTSADGKFVWWDLPAQARTTFYGSGTGGSVETTALAVLALAKAERSPGLTGQALAWLVSKKDAHGTWHSTQATVLALRALLSSAGKPAGGERERRIEITRGDGTKRELVIPADQAEVMQQVDLSEWLVAGKEQRVTVREEGDGGAGYQLAFRYHVPDAPAENRDPLALAIDYDRTELAVGETVAATATVTNRTPAAAPMVLLDLPVPGGFAAVAEDFAGLVTEGTVAKFQVGPRGVTVYLRGLEPGKPLKLKYRLRATLPAKVTVPGGAAYEYYDPDVRGASPATRFTVAEGK